MITSFDLERNQTILGKIWRASSYDLATHVSSPHAPAAHGWASCACKLALLAQDAFSGGVSNFSGTVGPLLQPPLANVSLLAYLEDHNPRLALVCHCNGSCWLTTPPTVLIEYFWYLDPLLAPHEAARCRALIAKQSPMPVLASGEELAEGGNCVAVEIGLAALPTVLIEYFCALNFDLNLSCARHHPATAVKRA